MRGCRPLIVGDQFLQLQNVGVVVLLIHHLYFQIFSASLAFELDILFFYYVIFLL